MCFSVRSNNSYNFRILFRGTAVGVDYRRTRTSQTNPEPNRGARCSVLWTWKKKTWTRATLKGSFSVEISNKPTRTYNLTRSQKSFSCSSTRMLYFDLHFPSHCWDSSTSSYPHNKKKEIPSRCSILDLKLIPLHYPAFHPGETNQFFSSSNFFGHDLCRTVVSCEVHHAQTPLISCEVCVPWLYKSFTWWLSVWHCFCVAYDCTAYFLCRSKPTCNVGYDEVFRECSSIGIYNHTATIDS